MCILQLCKTGKNQKLLQEMSCDDVYAMENLTHLDYNNN